MCRDPVIGVGEPGKVIQKLCHFSKVPNISGGPTGGIITYKCVGSQWEVKKNDCISAPINSLLQLAKVILKSLTPSSWWGALSSLSYFLANRPWDALCCFQNYFYLFNSKEDAILEMLYIFLKFKYGDNKICTLLWDQLYLDLSVLCFYYFQGAGKIILSYHSPLNNLDI